MNNHRNAAIDLLENALPAASTTVPTHLQLMLVSRIADLLLSVEKNAILECVTEIKRSESGRAAVRALEKKVSELK